MHEAKVRLERHTLAKISPSWSRLAIHESNCRMGKHQQESQSRVENPAMRITRSTAQNSCDYAGMRNFRNATVQN